MNNLVFFWVVMTLVNSLALLLNIKWIGLASIPIAIWYLWYSFDELKEILGLNDES
jgi:hypothetical protein